jgi:hypothetical protein
MNFDIFRAVRSSALSLRHSHFMNAEEDMLLRGEMSFDGRAAMLILWLSSRGRMTCAP